VAVLEVVVRHLRWRSVVCYGQGYSEESRKWELASAATDAWAGSTRD